MSKNARPSRGLVCDVIVRIVFLFLIGMVILAMFGRFKLRLPGGRRVEKCRACGKFQIGKGPCSCKRKS